jgi:hypothetical protein
MNPSYVRSRRLQSSAQLAQHRILTAPIHRRSKLRVHELQGRRFLAIVVTFGQSTPSTDLVSSLDRTLPASAEELLMATSQRIHTCIREHGAKLTFSYIQRLSGSSGSQVTVYFCCEAMSCASSERTHGMQRQGATKWECRLHLYHPCQPGVSRMSGWQSLQYV